MAGAANPNLAQAVGGSRPSLGAAPAQMHSLGPAPAEMQSVGAAPAQMQSPNINQMAAQGMYGAGMATAQGLGTPLQQANIAAYQNPYTQQVIDASAQDVLRNAQIGLNQLGTEATRAGAFGGSRHGVAMGEMGRGVAQMLGQQSAGLRQAGFQNAQQAAQFDIAQNQAAANQLANLSNLGFGMGQQVQQNLMTQGALQQGMQQSLIDAAKQQYAGYTGAPAASIGYVSSALGATPVPQTQTTSKQPGLFDFLTLALG